MGWVAASRLVAFIAAFLSLHLLAPKSVIKKGGKKIKNRCEKSDEAVIASLTAQQGTGWAGAEGISKEDGRWEMLRNHLSHLLLHLQIWTWAQDP